MPAAYTILVDARFVYSRAWGVVTDEELLAHAKALKADRRFQPAFAQVSDFRDVTDAALTSSGIWELARNNPFGAGARRAVVASQAVTYGLARMYELVLAESPDELKVVKNLEEAREWLGDLAGVAWDELEALKPDQVFGAAEN